MKLGAAECAAGRGPSRALPLPAPLREAAVRGHQGGAAPGAACAVCGERRKRTLGTCVLWCDSSLVSGEAQDNNLSEGFSLLRAIN